MGYEAAYIGNFIVQLQTFGVLAFASGLFFAVLAKARRR